MPDAVAGVKRSVVCGVLWGRIGLKEEGQNYQKGEETGQADGEISGQE